MKPIIEPKPEQRSQIESYDGQAVELADNQHSHCLHRDPDDYVGGKKHYECCECNETWELE